MKKYDYVEGESDIFGKVSRPLITIRFFSEIRNIWIPAYDTLVDSGADISIIPKFLGELLVENIPDGKEVEIKGVVPNSKLIGWLHDLKVIVAGKQFNLPVVIVNSDKTLVILGRVKGLDIFNVELQKGKHIVLEG